MFSFITDLFDFNKKELNRLQKIVDSINALESEMRDLADKAFVEETEQLKATLRTDTSDEALEGILPRSFALVREAARRTLGQRHYDVQLIAAIALHEGKVVEQKTGEGKTLTATAPLYLNALLGKGAHLVTVNDYLARRDAGWMGQIFHFLGLSTSAIISGESFMFDPDFTNPDYPDPRLAHLRSITRKEAYAADVTYGINSEFGFDYLRDNMAQRTDQMVQRGFSYAIVDEADSVLIDEARTPHIISAPYEQDTSKYYDYAKIVNKLQSEKDYAIDEKLRTAHLTEDGIEKIEQLLGVSNIYEKDFDTLYHIEAALKANTLFNNDKEYIVRNNEVVIVDEFTGRLLEGRRFSEGLHQAIEAKEGVPIKQESKTLATVSLQNYFRMYDKLAGMTGTAQTEAEEFHKIYGTEVLVVPTNMPIMRKDETDKIYKTMKVKFNAVVEDIAEQYKAGRPVLVGTTSIDKNELVSRLLKQKGIPHELLNAKNHENEARIIAQAGKKHAVTVATNMAGRGVDIVLGGEVRRADYTSDAAYNKAEQEWQTAHDEVVGLGGLYVIGTERHESRRIDNQLRGRSGRQGDPGETRFYVSLEDDVMRIFGGEQISGIMTMLKFPEDQPLSHSMVTRAIEQAQQKVEGFNFDIRKHLVEYDDVLNKQREILYSLRKNILSLPEKDQKAFEEKLFEMIEEHVSAICGSYFALDERNEAMDEDFVEDLHVLTNASKTVLKKKLNDLDDQEDFQAYILKELQKIYANKEKEVGKEIWQNIVRSLVLATIDTFWTLHLTAIEDLRQGINLRGYAQLDPLVEYKNEAFTMFEKLISDIQFESIRRVLRVDIEHIKEHHLPVEQPKEVEYQSASRINPYQSQTSQSQKAGKKNDRKHVRSPQPTHQKSQQSGQHIVSEVQTKPQEGSVPYKKIGRNDPCWCGSGKKWKKCHYPQTG
ncbi:preprotein translocase subunit SecA [Candidatus Woesebacteria bacterium]|nr:preprotein translocase subunit SecA [Candidatus Woesebacteria bacterium]